MNTKTHQNTAAFTLIELLVVMAIIGITASIVLTDWSGGRKSQQLNNSAQEVGAVIREAQNYALTGYQGVAGSEPCYFQVSWSGSSYSLGYQYKDAGGACNQSVAGFHSYALKDGVTFSGASSFNFSVPHAASSFGAGPQAIILTKQGIFAVVCVYSNGRVENYTGNSCP